MDDRELIGAAQGGDRSAFDELVRQTYVDTFTLARRLTGNEEDARDVAQDAYLRAWRGIGRFRGEAQFSTWMYRITANARGDAHPSGVAHRTESLDDDGEPTEQRLESLPGPAAESGEPLDRLSAADRDLAAQAAARGVLQGRLRLSHEAIAEELDISETAAKVRLHRARRKLKVVLYEERRSSPCGVTKSPELLPGARRRRRAQSRGRAPRRDRACGARPRSPATAGCCGRCSSCAPAISSRARPSCRRSPRSRRSGTRRRSGPRFGQAPGLPGRHRRHGRDRGHRRRAHRPQPPPRPAARGADASPNGRSASQHC